MTALSRYFSGHPAPSATGRGPGRIYVIAGTNGAGRSSLAGEAFRAAGVEFYDPDAAARHLRGAHPGLSVTDANAAAWHHGRRMLEQAIAGQLDFALETTLGGESMTALLERAAQAGLEVRVWFAGLSTPELHLDRVRRRVAKGGHDIPELSIRHQFDRSRENVVRLLPKLVELRMFDNSTEGDPDAGARPAPVLVLHWRDGDIVAPADLAATPGWAKPVVAAALKLEDSAAAAR